MLLCKNNYSVPNSGPGDHAKDGRTKRICLTTGLIFASLQLPPFFNLSTLAVEKGFTMGPALLIATDARGLIQWCSKRWQFGNFT